MGDGTIERRAYGVGLGRDAVEDVKRDAASLKTSLSGITSQAGMADKAVSLFYELRLHQQTSDLFVERCRTQVAGAAALLESDRTRRPGDFWFGARIGHADIAVACALRFIGEAHPGLLPRAQFPALANHASRLEKLPPFQAIAQAFIPPSS